jgi:hypothetical protein
MQERLDILMRDGGHCPATKERLDMAFNASAIDCQGARFLCSLAARQ